MKLFYYLASDPMMMSLINNPEIICTVLETDQKHIQFAQSLIDFDRINYREQWFITYLNKNKAILGHERHSWRFGKSTKLYLGLIFQKFKRHSAKFLLLTRNHPSETLMASLRDTFGIRYMEKVIMDVKVTVEDSLIIVPDGYYSFKEDGILHGIKSRALSEGAGLVFFCFNKKVLIHKE